MFSGIVQEVGIVKNLESKYGLLELTVSSECLVGALKSGSSIAINGCCQTVIEKDKNSFKVQATEETLKKTNFLNLKINSKVNLEPALKVGETIDGHLVSGHIDTVGEISDILSCGENQTVKISFPGEYGEYIAPKGSIAVNGVSLTIIDLDNVRAGLKPALTLTLIPFTRDNTNLGLLKIGDLVNLEVDLVSRYLVNYYENKTANVIKL